jgi:hypothetical protein
VKQLKIKRSDISTSAEAADGVETMEPPVEETRKMFARAF